MFRILHDAAVFDGRRETERDGVVIPAFRGLFDFRDQPFRAQAHAGIEFSFLARRDHQLHVRAADIDDENFLHECFLRRDIGASFTAGAFIDSASLRACLRERSRKCS